MLILAMCDSVECEVNGERFVVFKLNFVSVFGSSTVLMTFWKNCGGFKIMWSVVKWITYGLGR